MRGPALRRQYMVEKAIERIEREPPRVALVRHELEQRSERAGVDVGRLVLERAGEAWHAAIRWLARRQEMANLVLEARPLFDHAEQLQHQSIAEHDAAVRLLDRR